MVNLHIWNCRFFKAAEQFLTSSTKSGSVRLHATVRPVFPKRWYAEAFKVVREALSWNLHKMCGQLWSAEMKTFFLVIYFKLSGNGDFEACAEVLTFFLVINLNLCLVTSNQAGTQQLLKKVENGTQHKKKLGNTALDATNICKKYFRIKLVRLYFFVLIKFYQ